MPRFPSVIHRQRVLTLTMPSLPRDGKAALACLNDKRLVVNMLVNIVVLSFLSTVLHDYFLAFHKSLCYIAL